MVVLGGGLFLMSEVPLYLQFEAQRGVRPRASFVPIPNLR